jgi:hypothetical protein
VLTGRKEKQDAYVKIGDGVILVASGRGKADLGNRLLAVRLKPLAVGKPFALVQGTRLQCAKRRVVGQGNGGMTLLRLAERDRRRWRRRSGGGMKRAGWSRHRWRRGRR